jgi:hypothetical protein
LICPRVKIRLSFTIACDIAPAAGGAPRAVIRLAFVRMVENDVRFACEKPDKYDILVDKVEMLGRYRHA